MVSITSGIVHFYFPLFVHLNSIIYISSTYRQNSALILLAFFYPFTHFRDSGQNSTLILLAFFYPFTHFKHLQVELDSCSACFSLPFCSFQAHLGRTRLLSCLLFSTLLHISGTFGQNSTLILLAFFYPFAHFKHLWVEFNSRSVCVSLPIFSSSIRSSEGGGRSLARFSRENWRYSAGDRNGLF